MSQVSKHTINIELKHQNWFFNNLPRLIISNVEVGGGTTTYYNYSRMVSLPSAVARSYNSFEVPEPAEHEHVGTNIVNLAPAISMDADLKSAVAGISDLFNEMVIRGNISAECNSDDPAVGPTSFDGLDKIIRNELPYVWEEPLDLTDLRYIDAADSYLRSCLSELRPRPTFILGNEDLISALSALARRTGTYTMTQNDFGIRIGSIDGISLIPMGNRYAKDEQIIKTYRTNTKCRVNPDGEPGQTFETTAYVGSFGYCAIQGLQLQDELLSIGMAVRSKFACGMFTKVCLPKTLIEHPDQIEVKK